MSQSPTDRPASREVPDLPAGLGSSDPDAPVQYTSADVAGAAEVLRRAEDGEAELLLSLTDEQIAGLEGYERRQFTAAPWLDEHAEQRSVAAHVGLRALIAAGRVRSVIDAESGQHQWRADPEIAGCLVLRRTASGFTTAERTVQTEQGPQVHRLHYYVHAAGVLEEEVTALGIHRFTPLRSQQVGARLVSLVDPAGVAAGSGTPVRVRASALGASDLSQQLALTRALTVLTMVRTADGTVQQASVYATPTHVLTMEALDPGAEDPELEFRTVDATDLHALATVVVAGRGEAG
ncbi:hypothetical protein [Brachybacterium sp. FME24]|uniref:hypothetical protein n=1 Tax=Brachybacterium sp. FME24 TaxID=2742605 RepID=UPI0018660578|nr:hypothetical protein [Brachybacterium sp. FME24]